MMKHSYPFALVIALFNVSIANGRYLVAVAITNKVAQRYQTSSGAHLWRESREKAPDTTRAGSHADVAQLSEDARLVHQHRSRSRGQQNDRRRHDPVKVASDDLELGSCRV